uniref:Bifunctional inhibitor/plant lipid transfer protein/seed storage helical domain-containing protein n=1 Tax=Kalanchoe fedtschenkoi TaxID=63787 RepID=A0A7N0TF60_KALFE
MANQRQIVLVVLVLVAMLWPGVSAQSNGCTNVLISLSPCLDYISGNSSTPSSSCCSQLATVVGAQPECLCQVLNGGASGLNINQTQALALPAACNVKTPSLSNCNTGSPADAPDGSSPGTPNVPSTNNGGSSDGSTIRMSSLLLLVIIAASYVSTFSTC